MTDLYRLLAKGARFRVTDGDKVRTYTVTALDYEASRWWVETSTVTEEPGKPLFRGINRIPLMNVLAKILVGEARPLKDDEA
jgi:hypothetical protein